MDGTEDDAEAGSVDVWRRWTGERDVPFYRYCRLFDGLERVPLIGSRPPEGEAPPLRYVPPVVRWALRHTPLIVLFVTAYYWAVSFGPSALRELDSVIPAIFPAGSGVVVVLLALWFLALVLLVRLAIIPPSGRATLQAVVVYGLGIGLTLGLVLGFHAGPEGTQLPITPRQETAFLAIPWNFLWTLFFGGQLVYDGMLRTENMFTKLHTKRPSIVTPKAAYPSAFVARLQRHLDHSIPRDVTVPTWWPTGFPKVTDASVPTAYLFAVLFIAPFYLLGTFAPFGESPGPLFERAVAGLIPTVLNFFLVVVFFQFLVLIAFFNHLLTYHGVEPAADAAFSLSYVSGHPDEYAGFRDLGQFATRVNAILVVGGIYEAYQLSVHGVHTYPGIAGGVTVALLSWATLNLLPLATYGLAVLLWLYLSFWQIHKTMRRGRELEKERMAVEGEDEPVLLDSPVWPIDSRLLISVLSLDLLPMIPLLPFVSP